MHLVATQCMCIVPRLDILVIYSDFWLQDAVTLAHGLIPFSQNL